MIMLIERSRIPHLQPTMQRLQRRELIGITPSRRKQGQGDMMVVDARGLSFDNVMGHAAVRESDPGPMAMAGGRRGGREAREGVRGGIVVLSRCESSLVVGVQASGVARVPEVGRGEEG